MKESNHQKKESINNQIRKTNSKSGSNSKNSSKSLQTNSKQKRQSMNSERKNKPQKMSSDYYAKVSFEKKCKNNNSNSINEEIQENNKKCRRITSNFQKKQRQASSRINNEEQIDQYQQKQFNNDYQDKPEKKMKSPILKKIKQISSHGSIDFNGEIVQKSVLSSENKKINLGISIEEYSGYEPLETKKSKSKSKQKIKSKSKSRNKKTNKSKPKDLKSELKQKIRNSIHQENKNKKAMNENTTVKKPREKEKEKEKEKQEIINSDKNYMISPCDKKFKVCAPIEITELQQQIQEDLEEAYQYILSQELIKQRGQCLNILGKICSSMNLKRQAFSSALIYMDSFIDINTEIKCVKTIAIAALMMALKIDHAEMAGNGQQFSTLSSLQSFNSTKGMSISTEARSQEKKSKRNPDSRQGDSKQLQSKLKFNLNRPKLPNVLTTVLSHEQIFSEYDRILCKEEIIDMEMQMMVKLNFKLTIRSYTFWIDSLTTIWDSYIQQLYPRLKSKVCFRCVECAKNFSYLSTLVEVSYYFPYAYFYPKVILILSVMYLLIRIRLEYGLQKEEKGFDHYRMNLAKSTNAIFVDKMGINELFGEFLSVLKLDMGDIVSCCQYISHYFSNKILKMFMVEETREQNYEQHITLYHYNPQIYRFFQMKSGGMLVNGYSTCEKADLYY